MTGTWTPFYELMIDGPEVIDDLVELLLRTGSAQDYPIPDIPKPDPGSGYGPQFHDYLNPRFFTNDRQMDQAPVPGYRPMPDDVVVDYRSGFAAVPPGFRWRRRR